MWKDYKRIKAPKGYIEGLFFLNADTHRLEAYAKMNGVSRRKFWIFNEPDTLFKIRIWNAGIRILEEELKKVTE